MFAASTFLEASTIPHHSDVVCVHRSTSLGLYYIRKDLKLNLTQTTLYLTFEELCVIIILWFLFHRLAYWVYFFEYLVVPPL